MATLGSTGDWGVFLPALAASVDAARYWQEPDDEDLLLAEPALAAELLGIAEVVLQTSASGWWAETMDLDGQFAVSWPNHDEPEPQAPTLTGAESGLRRWRTDTAADEQRCRRERPADPRVEWSGEWWATPALAGLIVTTRALPSTADRGTPTPVGLSLVEDSSGWETGRSWPVVSPAEARVLELAGPADWVALVERYPFEVTASRRHDWWRVTGWDGAWVIPDWVAVAADVDAVHLTVLGYLSTAGRALPVDVPALAPARTVLSGWNPDATWWLTDTLTGLGDPTDWLRQGGSPRWAAVDK